MLIYKDFISGDEMVSDSYPMKVIDDFVYEFEGKRITVSNKIDESAIGANPSSPEGGGEGGGEDDAAGGTEDADTVEINIVYAHKLSKVNMDKPMFMTWIKSYMKQVAERLQKNNPERVESFKAKAGKFVKERILNDFGNWDFYMGESNNPDAGLALMNYREDGITPYFVFFKDGLEEVKY